MNKLTLILAIAVIGLAVPAAQAFNGHVAQRGPVKIVIDPMADVTQFDQPAEVSVTVTNDADSGVEANLRLTGLVDEWYAVGPTQATCEIKSKSEKTVKFKVAVGAGAVSALYPVHVDAVLRAGDTEAQLHAVQIVEAKLTAQPGPAKQPVEWAATTVPANGALPLWSGAAHRVRWGYYDQSLVAMPVGWTGTSPESSANFAVYPVTRGATRQALVMHPPWKPGGGTIFAEYKVRLPDVEPISLTFANAIRDHTASEPASDGVTFRVWAGEKKLFERHTDAKRWLEGRVDLSEYRGKEILLRFETHPGPNRNTTCDSAYWAEPILVAGEPPQPISSSERRQMRDAAAALARTQNGKGHLYSLDDGYWVAILPGRKGLIDGAIALADRDRCVVFDGFRLAVLGHTLDRPSAVTIQGFRAEDSTQSLIVRHQLLLEDEPFELTVRLRPDRSALRIKIDCPKRITDFSLGPADQQASRVYYGHGYCIVEPKAFRAGFGGHNLSTSHVGFDFEKGLSLLVATDHPPDFLEVDPDRRLYALHTHLDATMALVPSRQGAFDCAFKYRPLYDKQASPGLTNKAGRFVFDIWGGRYAEIADTMKRMIDYGLTDSLLTVHVWQRWGYDYRLPDIYPPQPSLGTVADMRKIGEVCDAHDIPWGLHDNYIDFYPDADEYSYDHICFTDGGQPVRAWLNEGRDAQSYRWRPDRIMPFVQRNMKLIKPNLKPTHYFIDVFTSIGCFDYWDKQGNFYSMLETRKHWGESFAWIRDYFGENAPMTSEAGHDQLIGYLDGSDCQHLQITSEPQRFCIHIDCKDWQRVPWFDAVLHDKLSLHGVGYSGRYQGGRDRAEHGIESDDYISAEILEGHALMIDRPAFGRGAIRKYWLAQDVARSVALDQIDHVEFADADIHRQIVRWKSGATVYVNRARSDWRVAGKVLGQDGYHVTGDEIESSIEKIGGVTVEQSRGPGRWYFNARGYDPEGALSIRPQVARFEYLGGRRFKLPIAWLAGQPTPKDAVAFVHFASPQSKRSDRIAFQADTRPDTPTSRWSGRIVTGEDRVVSIPQEYGPGRYEVKVGLWDPVGGTRYRLQGKVDRDNAVILGTVVAEGGTKGIRSIRFEPVEGGGSDRGLWNVERREIDFGPAVTEGAFRCEVKTDGLVVTPLPQIGGFGVALRLDRLLGRDDRTVRSVEVVDTEGVKIRDVEIETSDGIVRFQVEPNEFAYYVHLSR